jgi:SSS family solute:Na+ symporter
MVVALGLLSLGLWLAYRTTLVDLLLLTYNGISQFMPAYAFGAYWKRTTTAGVTAGIVAGIVLALSLAATGHAPFGLNPGFIGLTANVLVLIGVSLLTRPREANSF